jgi:hypothetical protein
MFNLRSKTMSNRVHSPLQLLTVSLAFVLCLFASSAAHAQGAAFTYQGRLTDSGNPVTGVYDMQFKLFDTATVGAGTQHGATITNSSVQVTNGGFSVELDFGLAVFDGSARFLEIALRPAGSADPYTVLSPRQPLTATPYALHSATADTALNATQLGGQPASGFIQNTTMQQPDTSFNIGGNGMVGGTLTGGVLNAATQYQIGGLRMLAANGPFNNGFTILAASNTFLSENAGIMTMPSATLSSPSGKLNTFVGANAGKANTDGGVNSFFGAEAGLANTSGLQNSFFGVAAGRSNTTASNNSFFGVDAGLSNSTGSDNAFFGAEAGRNNATGIGNTLIGVWAGLGSNDFRNATAIGYRAHVDQSNSLVLGSISGVNSCEAITNCGSVNVGIGTIRPATRLDVVSAASQIRFGDTMADNGGYLTSTETSQAIISAGAKWDGFFWVAKGTGASLISQFAGEISFFTNPSLTPSENFTPTERMRITTDGRVGIGTAAPRAKLHIQGGNLFIAQPNSLVITSQNGACWFITVNNSGVLSTISTPCP